MKLSLFGIFFYWIDLAIAISMIIIVSVLYKMDRIDKLIFILFWIGACIGSVWEIPLFLISEISICPIIMFLVTPPFHYSVIIVIHSIWDGGLFLIGVGLIYLFCKPPHFDKFNVRELLILVIWAQLQAIGIELLGTFGGAWEYIPYWWNPVMFSLFGHNFTIMIQLIWLVAPFVFYYIALKLKQKLSGNSKNEANKT
ncbi:MAG: hypothetical protein ACTSSI_15220 [Candidatus Helarchaeota archaeon]